MKKIVTIIFLFMIMGTSWASAQSRLIFTGSDNQLKINEITKNGFEFDLSIGKAFVKDADSKEGNYFILQTQGFTKSTQIGKPDLPSKGRLIEVPFEAAVKIEILSSETQVVNLGEKGLEGKILPCQPSVAKCGDTENLPFKFNAEVYNSNSFYGDELVSYEESGVMRGTRLGRIEMNPFRYNPVTNELLVYTDMKVKITFENANYAKTEEMKNIYGNSMFNSLLTKTMNYNKEAKPLNENQPVKLLIIADRMFEESLVPFVEWKTISGFETTVRYTDESEIGSTTTSIKSYLQDLYDAATTEDPAPSFVLLVGDVAQIPAFSGISTIEQHVSDLYYFTYDGTNDIIPDINYGRFSAQTPDHLDAIIEKTLLYEKYEMADPSYLSNTVLVAGSDADWATVHGNGAINYINDVHMANDGGVNVNMYHHPEAFYSGDAIIQNVSDGIAWANYTGHGSPSGWLLPSFSNSDVLGLQNNEKYGLLIGNCCLSNKFDDESCFGETLLRAEDKGAIGYIGGSNTTYWDEDYYWATGYGEVAQYPSYEDFGNGAYDLYYHQNIEDQPREIWAPTQSQVNLAGVLAVEESNSTRKTYYWEIYHLMGDPTLMPWIGVPDAMAPNYPSSIVLGMDQLEVANLPAYARVALSNHGGLLATATANASGSATLEFESFTAPTTAQVVITAQFKQPYVGELEVIPCDEPFVVYDNHTINDGADGNEILDYGENVMLDVSVTNQGTVSTDNIELTLSTTDQYVTITENIATLGEALAETTYSIEDAFAFEVTGNVPDQYAIEFTLTADDGVNNPWETVFVITASAPVIELTSIILTDADGNNKGNLEPGEISTFKILVANVGHAASMDVTSTLTALSDNITVANEIITVSEIDGQLATEFVHTVTASETADIGDIAELNLEIVAGETTINKTIKEAIGLLFEGFESEDFNRIDWVNNDQRPWVITESACEGEFAAKAGACWGVDPSELSAIMNITNEGELSFMHKISSLYYYTVFRFYIDGVLKDEWNGDTDWEKSSYIISEGVHTFTWSYENSTFNDHFAYIDSIVFPPVSADSHNIAFLVTDESNNPVAGASVNIADVTLITDDSGIATIKLFNGLYDYTVSREGYDEYTGSITVEDGNVSEEVILMINRYTVSFSVVLTCDWIENASVSINAQELTLNEFGEASFDLLNGDYEYIVSAEGLSDHVGVITVDGADETVIIRYPFPVYIASFTVLDESGIAIEGAEIAVGYPHITTNINGLASVSLQNGTYNVVVTKDGYQSYNETITVEAEDLSVEIRLNGMESLPFGYSLYPNPVQTELQVEVDAISVIEIYSVSGTKMYEEQVDNHAKIDVSTLPRGVYILRLFSQKYTITEQLIVE